MKTITHIVLLALVLIAGACSNANKGGFALETRYLPVMTEGSEKWSILDVESGELVVKDAYTATPSAVVGGMYFVPTQDGTYNYYNVANPKQAVNKVPYGSVSEFGDNGLAVASERGGNIVVIDEQCNTVAQLGDSIVECSNFTAGLAMARDLSGKYGYIDKSGHWAFAKRWDRVTPFTFDNLTVVMNQTADSIMEFSVIDKKGEVSFTSNTTMYVPLAGFNQGALPVQKRDTIVCINADGKEVPNPFEAPEAVSKAGYESTSIDGNGNWLVVKGGKFGVVDDKGATLIPIKYDQIVPLATNRYLVSEKDGVFVLTDSHGKQVGKTRIIHVNGTPASVAVRGFIEPQVTAANILSMFNEDHFGGIPKGATVGSFQRLINFNAPEQYVGQDGMALPGQGILVGFAGPIVTQSGGQYTFNTTTPVKMLIFNFDANAYGIDTEQRLVDIIKASIGQNGFVNQGNNTFVSTTGTALAVGYKDGVLRLNYYMNAADLKPMPAEPRKK